jgi:hypothetical protein
LGKRGEPFLRFKGAVKRSIGQDLEDNETHLRTDGDIDAKAAKL